MWSRLGALLLLMSVASTSFAAKINEIASFAGVRNNQLIGYGLVVGLDGSGDRAGSTPFTAQTLGNMLNQLGVQIPAGMRLDPRNVAAVSLTAVLPPFARSGQTIDVTASSIGDAKSIRGGTLLMAPLKGVDGQIYALAQGNILVGGAGASSAGSSAQINQLSVGRIPAGAIIERELPSVLGGVNNVQLELKEASFTTANRVVNAINRELGNGIARAIDGRLIEVSAPQDTNSRVHFLSRLENIEVAPAEATPLVIINARTGSVVMNQNVQIEECAVSHGNLSVSIGNNPSVSQPRPGTAGQTAVTNQANVNIKSDGGKVLSLKKSASLSQVVSALNAIGATPMDLISILQAMKAAGSLKAELQVI